MPNTLYQVTRERLALRIELNVCAANHGRVALLSAPHESIMCVYAHVAGTKPDDGRELSACRTSPGLLALAPVPRGDRPSVLKQQRLLKEASDLFGRKVIADGLKISEKTLEAWMTGRSEMPDTMLIALAHLLVQLAGKDRK